MPARRTANEGQALPITVYSGEIQNNAYHNFLLAVQPLHYAAAYVPAEEIDDMVPRVLRIGRGAAAIQNNKDEYPIDLAVRCGRKWGNGCRLLVEAFAPAVLVHLAPDITSSREIIFQLTQKSLYTPIFDMLRANPDILVNCQYI